MALAAEKMALRPSSSSSASARLCLPSSSSSSTSKPSLFKPQLRPFSVSLPTSTAISLLAVFTPPLEAKALPKDQIVSTLTDVEKTIDQVQEVGSGFLDTAQRVFGIVSDTLKPALPIVKQAGDQALKIASPAISEASKKAQEAIQSSGIDTEPVLSAAKIAVGAAEQTSKVIEEVKPIVSSTVETILSTDPLVIVGTAGAVFLGYLLLPPVWSVISYSLRGYKGELTPAQTLDLISAKNYFMIDIRPAKDKDRTGIPRVPSSARNKLIAIPLEELPNKLRSLVRNVKKVEAEITALKISYLKKVNKGSNIIIMDSYSNVAKIVAKALTSLGFKNCWIVADGFSGSKGWLQSRLGVDSYSIPFVEVISPSRIIPAAARRIGTTSTKLLPGSD